MSCPKEIRNIYVTSTNRDVIKNPYGNSYTLYLTTPIKDITNVELLYASIPNTMYNLNNGSNVIGFTNTSHSGETFVTIPVGFYGSTSLSTAVYNANQFYSNVSVSFLSGEGKFFFTRPDSFVMYIETQELATLLGFDFPACSSGGGGINGIQSSQDVTTTPSNAYANNLAYRNLWYIKSKYVVDMNVNDGVFLDIQELRTMYNECTPRGSPFANMNNSNSSVINQTSSIFNSTASRSFGMIPMDVSSGCIKRFKKQADFESQVDYTYPIQKLDRLTVSWTDKYGNLLNFNGAEDNAFILRFHTLRKNLC